jgi:rare lipoprotein A
VSRWLAAALLACACSQALSQQGPEPVIVTAFHGATAAAEAIAASSLKATADAGQAIVRLETGLASWYGSRFHGRKTASGEAYDMHALTAAHPKLPFGSWVRVRNLVNGRSVDVRINDRGPHIKRRIIDLSRAAAQSLGLAGHGTRQVEITLLEKGG